MVGRSAASRVRVVAPSEGAPGVSNGSSVVTAWYALQLELVYGPSPSANRPRAHAWGSFVLGDQAFAFSVDSSTRASRSSFASCQCAPTSCTPAGSVTLSTSLVVAGTVIAGRPARETPAVYLSSR
jgi:hypothetical protein